MESDIIAGEKHHLTYKNGNPVFCFREALFGPISDAFLNQPETVKFTEQDGMMPLSVLEAVALRAFSDDPKALEYQRTRLGAIYVPIKGEVYVAFDDIPDAKKNIAIAQAQKGYDLNTAGKELTVSGRTLRNILRRAKPDQRFLPVPQDGHVKSSIAECRDNQYFDAIEGCMAGVNARLIQRNTIYETINLWMLKPDYVLKCVKEGEAIVLCVGLGGGKDGYGINYIDATDRFDSIGRASGIFNARLLR